MNRHTLVKYISEYCHFQILVHSLTDQFGTDRTRGGIFLEFYYPFPYTYLHSSDERYLKIIFIDDEGNMVTETYYVKEEMTNEEIEKQKKEDEKRKSPAAKSNPAPKKIASKSSASAQKGSMKQKSISSFFKPKSK